MKISTHLLYEDNTHVTLTTYLHEDSKELISGKRRPAILVVPGGGYFGCSDREGEMVALRFASMGYHAFVLRYTTYFNLGEMNSSLREKISPRMDRVYPKALHDLGSAMIFIRRNASEWLVDDDNIVLAGFSAGGHNCAMYATHWNKEILTDHFNKDRHMLKPQGVILGYAITDFMELSEQGLLREDTIWSSILVALLGDDHPDEVDLNMISPARHVSSDTAPMFIWATSEDNLVPANQSLLMAKSLADHKISYECHIYEKGMHGLSLATQATSQSKSQDSEAVRRWIDEATGWLERRFPLELDDITHWEKEK